MTGAFLFLKDIAFIQFTRCGLIAKICHRGNSHQKEMCYDSSIRNKTAITLKPDTDGTCFIKNSLTGKPLKLKAGTYYIKVTRSTRGASGAYTFKCRFK